jgi:hypothetical protein
MKGHAGRPLVRESSFIQMQESRARISRSAKTCAPPQLRRCGSKIPNSHQDTDVLGSADGAALVPVLPLILEKEGVRLSLFTVISTFGTAQDVTTDEMRIESFFPSDAETEAVLRSLGTEQVAAVLNEMAPDDRTALLEELPAAATKRLSKAAPSESLARFSASLD